MPLPKPNKNEKNSKFMTRCISQLESKKEFKDNKQRIAVCYSQLARNKSKKKS
jgi:hypothetical protein|tara:strand:- start:4285 stop:4443 length:159 start_codon:yes stop_codon:yes gene_type:complete